MARVSEIRSVWTPKYDYLWNPLVDLMTKYTSIWWFFLLLPKQSNRYGPKQLMYTFATRKADIMCLNGRWCRGMQTPKHQAVNSMNGVATGWYFDGKRMYEELSFLSGSLVLDTPRRSLQLHGPHIDKANRVHKNSDYFAHTHQDGKKVFLKFLGPAGEGRFEFWMDHVSEMTKPFVLNRQVRFGGVHMAALKYMNFKGTIETENGKEQLEGIGYFQKVMMNIPMFPWLWHWSAGEDGSVLSYFTAYVGYQSLRRSSRIWPHSFESRIKNILPSAYFYDKQTHQEYNFEHVHICPEARAGQPYFKCYATNPGTNDLMQFRCYPYQHNSFITERPLIRGINSKFNYHEYLVRVGDLKLHVDNEEVSLSRLGQIYGNCEYTWGLSL